MTDNDIVNRLAAEFAPENDRQIVLSTTVDADLLRDAKAEIERLRAAGDELAEWADHWANVVLDQLVDVTAVIAWREARRER